MGQAEEVAMQVGFIGLGNMGGPLAGFVRAAGLDLVVHDLPPEAAAPLLARGAGRKVDEVSGIATSVAHYAVI